MLPPAKAWAWGRVGTWCDKRQKDSASLRGWKFFDILSCGELGIHLKIKTIRIGLFSPLSLTEGPERVLQGKVKLGNERSVGRLIFFQNRIPQKTTVSWNFQTPNRFQHDILTENKKVLIFPKRYPKHPQTKNKIVWMMQYNIRLE